MTDKKKVIVADDHGIVRMGLIQILDEFTPPIIVFEKSDYKSLFEEIRKTNFDLLILDVNMPNGNFVDALDLIKRVQPKLKILVFSSHDESLYALRYLKMGADGYLNKLSSRETILKAISQMLETGKYYSDQVKEMLIEDVLHHNKTQDIHSLSNRELSVAQELAKGITQKDISSKLNLHPSTVSTYKNRIFEKLNIKSIPELIDMLKLENVI